MGRRQDRRAAEAENPDVCRRALQRTVRHRSATPIGVVRLVSCHLRPARWTEPTPFAVWKRLVSATTAQREPMPRVYPTCRRRWHRSCGVAASAEVDACKRHTGGQHVTHHMENGHSRRDRRGERPRRRTRARAAVRHVLYYGSAPRDRDVHSCAGPYAFSPDIRRS